ncbi:hypothetical protein UFOVP412_14 [uncultured Caudovirales phage]|uniref:Uncharacterized protein n=1 Tax=uncultured Caudovirales phage TaxID=2100421 RepID=A0A6J5M6J9_9CAUD|nr:hypothetical protein UFOVP412_14 [uncultured Caudovirales phage]
MIYYIRAKESDWPEVESLAVTLGLAKKTPAGLVGQGWVYIGPVYQPTGKVSIVDGIETPETAAVRAKDGSLYLHANIVYDGSLRALAESVTSPEVAAALQSVPKYFLVDDEGNPRSPAEPVRVIF